MMRGFVLAVAAVILSGLLAGCGQNDSVALIVKDAKGHEEVYRSLYELKDRLEFSGPVFLMSDYPMEVFFWDEKLGKYHLGNRQFFAPGIWAEISGQVNKTGKYLVVFECGWTKRDRRLEVQLPEVKRSPHGDSAFFYLLAHRRLTFWPPSVKINYQINCYWADKIYGISNHQNRR